jgi:hypothetical protein
LNSGELEVDEVATLARRCRWKALKGEVCPDGLVVNPRAVIEVPRRCCGTLGADGADAEMGDGGTGALEAFG